ncbi:MAG: hypoxanthine phosphoribosyltransferase [Pseudohongiellaceae bacterium]|jgi:hypoxanthine phosphoribosyltransferase
MNKQYISAQQLLDDSFQLGLNILESGYRPNFIVAIWRGGTPVGIAIQELLDYFGHPSDHIAIRTAFYTGINERADKVQVFGLGYVEKNIKATDSLLIVDDVHDTGLSMAQVLADIEQHCGDNAPEIRIATPYFKPDSNKTTKTPDYYLHKTDKWLVFPHELAGLKAQEILDNKPGIDTLKAKLKSLT